MSCHHCTTKFNFFHKETGCANCGLSFCTKCVKQKCKVPMKGNNELNVCRTCYSKLTSDSSTPPSGSCEPRPPDAFLRRLESLENPVAPPITMYKQQNPRFQGLRAGLSPADQKILERLEKLKENHNKPPPPTETELRTRLARLKGGADNNYVEGPSSKPFVFTPDTRTDQQKADALLSQFADERDIELAHDPQVEIEARLATLRGQGVRPNEGPYVSNLHDDSPTNSIDEVEKITRKVMDQVALDERMTDDEDEDDGSGPELPWCVLCNKDACYRCDECGGDLYCRECAVEVHKSWEDRDHKMVTYKKPK